MDNTADTCIMTCGVIGHVSVETRGSRSKLTELLFSIVAGMTFGRLRMLDFYSNVEERIEIIRKREEYIMNDELFLPLAVSVKPSLAVNGVFGQKGNHLEPTGCGRITVHQQLTESMKT